MTATDRRDAIDIEAFETMIGSPAFALFMEHVDLELMRALATCETATDPNAIYRGQGAAHAIRAILRMPKAMQKKMVEGTWKAPPPLRSNKIPNV